MPKGMMLAAGRGTRLCPLTDYIPKPLLPVANLPVMAYGLQALRRLGITEICSNVSYRADQILAIFGDGGAHGVKLHWSIEQEPTGTAGGMKGMQTYLDSDLVVVIAGDAMLDLDLRPLLAGHRERGAFATLATVPVRDPSQYGVVVTDSEYRIISFQEKPAPGTEISRQANTGIYIFDPGIFDLIPAGEFTDFALNVFPRILQLGLPFYAIPVTGYWTDIGNPGDYLQANLDYLAGRIKVEGRGSRYCGNLVGANTITDDALLDGCTVGDGASLSRGCVLTNTVIWPGTVITTPMRLSSAVLTPNAAYSVIGKEATTYAGALSTVK